MNKTTEALKYDILVLKIAARFLHKAVSAKERCDYWIVKELIAKKEMQLAEPVKQEPVAWLWVCVDVESRSIETGLLFNRGADDENTDWTPLYAAPVSVEAIRARSEK